MRQRFITLALVGLAIATGLNALGITGKASHDQVASALALQEKDSCIRGNVRNATDNSSHLSNYNSLKQQITFTKSTLTADYIALKKAGVPLGTLNVALTHSKAALKSQEAQLATLTWTAMVNCAAAPSPKQGLEVHSIATEKPPLYALSVQNALRVSPVGGVQ